MPALTAEMQQRLSADIQTKIRGGDMDLATTLGDAIRLLCFSSRVLQANGVDPIAAIRLFNPSLAQAEKPQ